MFYPYYIVYLRGCKPLWSRMLGEAYAQDVRATYIRWLKQIQSALSSAPEKRLHFVPIDQHTLARATGRGVYDYLRPSV